MEGETENELDPKKTGKMSSNYSNERLGHKRRNEPMSSENEVKEERQRITCKSLST